MGAHASGQEHPVLNANTVVLAGLLPALQRLDRLLEQAISRADVIYGPQAATDLFRGLHLDKEDMQALLTREPCAPILWKSQEQDQKLQEPTDDGSRLGWLQQAYGLTSFDIDVILVTLAPELDLRYERLYAYLQDDVTKKRPTVDLVLNLLCPSAEAKLASRSRLATNAPLLSSEVLQLIPDPNQPQPPLLAHYVKLDDQIVRLLLGEPGLDPRLASFCQFVEPDVDLDELSLDAETRRALSVLGLQAIETHQPLALYFHGPAGVGKRQCAEALAKHLGMPLIVGHLDRLAATNAPLEGMLTPLFREAWFNNALLLLDGVDILFEKQRSISYKSLMHKLGGEGGITILTGEHPWPRSSGRSENIINVLFPTPDFAHRRICWQTSFACYGIEIEDVDHDTLSERFRLTPHQIAEAVASAFNQARWRQVAHTGAEASEKRNSPPFVADLFHAAREQSGHDLAALAQKIRPRYTWNDIVLPDDTLTQLHEICQRVVHRHHVFDEWGFDRKLSLGKGVNTLFAGPSGAGKTMAAEVIANELGLDLYKVDLSAVVSKYIGETEKNLDRIFTAAENANAILLFDEADALFGKRSEVRDSHDRYSNIETCYLLQKMEQFDGIAILATNQRQNLDAAFTRRLAFTIHFPFPDEANRQQIWEGIWPVEALVADDVDQESLASRFKLSGGNIKNVALAASFLAAEDGGPITMAHLLRATRREYQKMGKVLSEVELNSTDNRPVPEGRNAA